MPRERIRKVSTLLFQGKASDMGDWSGIAIEHRNAGNHQLTLSCSGVLAAGTYRVRIIPNDDTVVEASIDTGEVLDMTGANSAIANFSGVIKGIHLDESVALSGGETISLVLSSYTKITQEYKNLDTIPVVSTNILNKRSSSFGEFSREVPRHSEMIYHQLIIASSQVLAAGKYRVRLIPDVDQGLESSIDISKELDISGNTSALVQFTGVLKGLHLEVSQAFSAGATISVVLSSAIERFDSIVAEAIGSAPGVHTHVEADITDLDKYTQAQVDALITAHETDANTHTNLILDGQYF